MRTTRLTLEGPDVPWAVPDSPNALDFVAIILGVITAAVALGAAALAALGADTGVWRTDSLVGSRPHVIVPYTLRELAAFPWGYSADVWLIGVGVIALSCGGLLALIAGSRRHVRWLSLSRVWG